ncbi:MAG: class I SAM-dependent methyltransferase [Chloroflexi bacterium]|nr:class I SAM-dependent methyltransferase [Chloroflexota bacterium]
MTQVAHGEPRFAFGKNWAHFLSMVDDQRIAVAERSLREMLETADLAGRSFLDVGCGSGLFSLAARRLGARVHAFDDDPEAVACAQELRRRYGGGDAWTVERGSILDQAYVASLGQFDVVYAWGVLHHTGAVWRALDNAAAVVAPGGRLFIAIYNDQGALSVAWRAIKRTYNVLPEALRLPFALLVALPLEAKALAAALLTLRPWRYVQSWLRYGTNRGMSRWHDLVDWIGGYPFEVAKPEAVLDFCRARGFTLAKLKTCGGKLGCNEFVFVKTAPA